MPKLEICNVEIIDVIEYWLVIELFLSQWYLDLEDQWAMDSIEGRA